MKKHSRLAFGVFWAGMMFFVAVQAAPAQVLSGPYSIEGTIIAMTGDGLEIDSEEYGTINVYGMGPDSYWDSQEVSFPSVGDVLLIVAYEMDNSKYVAASIKNLTQETTITLREAVSDSDGSTHLIPLWSNSKNLPRTETTVITANAVDCTCDCKCYCYKEGCDCACDCEDCLDNESQYQKGNKSDQ